MVALENNLFVLLCVLAVLAAAGALGWALWRPVFSRAWRYFVVWWERDRIEEAEARRSHGARQKAEREVRECLNEADEEPAEVYQKAGAASVAGESSAEPSVQRQEVR